jgi:drug/metabolite transporter (DMT)-like permease
MLLTACVVLDAGRELCFKSAAVAPAGQQATFVAWTSAGIVLWTIEILAYLKVLADVPLNIAFPAMSLTYVVSLLAAIAFLGERISARRWVGTGFITAGVALIGLAGTH